MQAGTIRGNVRHVVDDMPLQQPHSAKQSPVMGVQISSFLFILGQLIIKTKAQYVYVIIHFYFSSFLASPSYLGSCWQQPRVQPGTPLFPAQDKTALSSASTKALTLRQGPTRGPSASSTAVGLSPLGDKFDPTQHMHLKRLQLCVLDTLSAY